jgi:hypothetical protein
MARRSTGGNASKAKADNASQLKGRETTEAKRRIAPAATLRLSVSDLIKELNEAREQQTATSEVLQSSMHRPEISFPCSMPCWRRRCGCARPHSAPWPFPMANLPDGSLFAALRDHMPN